MARALRPRALHWCMRRRFPPYQRTSRLVPRPLGSARCPAVSRREGQTQNSTPCSQVRSQKLPDCFSPACAFASLLLLLFLMPLLIDHLQALFRRATPAPIQLSSVHSDLATSRSTDCPITRKPVSDLSRQACEPALPPREE